MRSIKQLSRRIFDQAIFFNIPNTAYKIKYAVFNSGLFTSHGA